MAHKKYLAECIGTFSLVFCGTGAIVVNDLSQNMVGHLGICFTFGLIVTAMVYAFGNVSGAHINPAVTLAFSITDRFENKYLIGYLMAQLFGALLASVALQFLFVEHEHLGATLPVGSWQQSFLLEVIMTYILMVVILFVSQNKAVSQFTGLAVGGTVLLEAVFAGPISGASMNPARSIGPAVISGHMDHLWIYLVAPVLGGLLASLTWFVLKVED